MDRTPSCHRTPPPHPNFCSVDFSAEKQTDDRGGLLVFHSTTSTENPGLARAQSLCDLGSLGHVCNGVGQLVSHIIICFFTFTCACHDPVRRIRRVRGNLIETPSSTTWLRWLVSSFDGTTSMYLVSRSLVQVTTKILGLSHRIAISSSNDTVATAVAAVSDRYYYRSLLTVTRYSTVAL
jgi:hypothetical protein